MKNIFSKIKFQKPKGGNLYEYKEAETTFEIIKDGFFVIKIIASAKNAEQNNSTDDDDLRMTIDDYAFGKYELNKQQLSFKGFNTSASWNGANLKGKIKTVYFFVNLNKGIHTLKFYADNTPILKCIEVYEIENNNFYLNASEQTNHQSFIFTNTFPKNLLLNYNGLLDTKTFYLFINGKKLISTELQNKILKENPESIIYKANNPIIKIIKLDPAFKQITTEITKKIKQGDLEGEIIPNNISFETDDLKYSIHGIKKIEYTAKINQQGKYKVKITLYDVYDFQHIEFPSIFDSKKFFLATGNNLININEELGFVNNFEIQILITTLI